MKFLILISNVIQNIKSESLIYIFTLDIMKFYSVILIQILNIVSYSQNKIL